MYIYIHTYTYFYTNMYIYIYMCMYVQLVSNTKQTEILEQSSLSQSKVSKPVDLLHSYICTHIQVWIQSFLMLRFLNGTY